MYFYIGVLVVGIVIVFVLLKKDIGRAKPQNIKDSGIKKEEIIKEYEEKMKKIILTYQGDANTLRQKQNEFLRQVNRELSRNIFFEADEIKSVLERLLKV